MGRMRRHERGLNGTGKPGPLGSFTLIELLTVIALIAILASLLLTAIASAKKKSRMMVCNSNLHQLSLTVNVDMGTQPGVTNLEANRYLPTPAALLCPEDNTGNWGLLLQSPPQVVQYLTATNPGGTFTSTSFSYLAHPLVWTNSLWNRVMHGPNWVGLAACQLHGLGNQNVSDVRSYTGLLLRAQRDGAVVPRQMFWNWSLNGLPNLPPGATNEFYMYPLPVYVDNPLDWLEGPP
jgi:prepilin-type N-terminal cleavage/methylation domain-containing protein